MKEKKELRFRKKLMDSEEKEVRKEDQQEKEMGGRRNGNNYKQRILKG